MKVGTDGVLLGAWAEAFPGGRILDIGTGTGILSLMMAQRFTGVRITAIEIDPGAAADARQNFQESPWAGQLELREVSLTGFCDGSDTARYEVIVCNPPYFFENIRSHDPGRHRARHAEHLAPAHLLQAAGRLLVPEGILQLILPEKECMAFILAAQKQGLHLCQQMVVRSRAGQPPIRRLMCFGRGERHTRTDQLVIYHEKEYSPTYRNLTRDFYL